MADRLIATRQVDFGAARGLASLEPAQGEDGIAANEGVAIVFHAIERAGHFRRVHANAAETAGTRRSHLGGTIFAAGLHDRWECFFNRVRVGRFEAIDRELAETHVSIVLEVLHNAVGRRSHRDRGGFFHRHAGLMMARLPTLDAIGGRLVPERWSASLARIGMARVTGGMMTRAGGVISACLVIFIGLAGGMDAVCTVVGMTGGLGSGRAVVIVFCGTARSAFTYVSPEVDGMGAGRVGSD